MWQIHIFDFFLFVCLLHMEAKAEVEAKADFVTAFSLISTAFPCCANIGFNEPKVPFDLPTTALVFFLFVAA